MATLMSPMAAFQHASTRTLLPTEVPRSHATDGDRDEVTGLWIAMAGAAHSSLTLAFLRAMFVVSGDVPFILSTLSFCVLLAAGVPLAVYLIVFRTLAKKSDAPIGIKAAHAAVVSTPGALWLGATLPVLAVPVGLAMDASSVPKSVCRTCSWWSSATA